MAFAKLFQRPEYGQVLAVFGQDEEGHPAVHWHAQPPGFGLCVFSLCFDGEDADEKARAAFDKVGEEAADVAASCIWKSVGGSFAVAENSSHGDVESWNRDEDRTWHALLLVGGHDVPRVAVAGWTDEECRQAENWARREHLHASDHADVERLPMPAHIAEHP